MTGNKKKRVTIVLSQEVIEWLRANINNKSAYVEWLIRQDARMPTPSRFERIEQLKREQAQEVEELARSWIAKAEGNPEPVVLFGKYKLRSAESMERMGNRFKNIKYPKEPFYLESPWTDVLGAVRGWGYLAAVAHLKLGHNKEKVNE